MKHLSSCETVFRYIKSGIKLQNHKGFFFIIRLLVVLLQKLWGIKSKEDFYIGIKKVEAKGMSLTPNNQCSWCLSFLQWTLYQISHPKTYGVIHKCISSESGFFPLFSEPPPPPPKWTYQKNCQKSHSPTLNIKNIWTLNQV